MKLVRITDANHKRLRMKAIHHDTTIQDLTNEALQQYLQSQTT